jgi:tetratricopeptide (TPR) repeat protein
VWRDPIALWQDNANKLPSNRRAWEILGKYLVLAGRYEESLAASGKSAIISKDENGVRQYTYSHEALLNLIVANIKLKRFDIAKKLVADGLKSGMNPLNRSKLLTNYANIFYQEGNLSEAEKLYKEAIDVFPAGLPPRINLGAIYAGTGRYDEAEQIWNEAAQIDPNSPSVLQNMKLLKEIRNK